MPTPVFEFIRALAMVRRARLYESAVITGLIVFALAQCAVNYYRSTAIDALVRSSGTTVLIEQELTRQLAVAQGDLVALREHLDELTMVVAQMRGDIDFVQKQGDILVAAKRSGRNGHKVVDAWVEMGGK